MDTPSKSPISKAPIAPQPTTPAPAPTTAPAPAATSGSPARTPDSFRPEVAALAGSPKKQAEAARGLQKSRGNQFAGKAIQRKCACGACADCDKKRDSDRAIQRQAKTPGAEPVLPPEAVTAMEQSSGKPIPDDLPHRMESKFGRKFEDVLIHTDSPAATAAHAIDARAFTAGRNIYFAQGEWQPETDAGRDLLAHELTHVVQQRGAAVPKPAGKMAVNNPGDALEREADRAASDVRAGRKPDISGSGDGRVHRKAAKCKAPDVKGMDDATEALVVPAEKGGAKGPASAEYEAAVLDCRLSTLAKFTRPSTDTLRNTWKRKSGVAFPTTLNPGGAPCEVDHIIELQVGGTNDPENLQLLEKDNNGKSGSKMNSQITKLKNATGNDKLRFTAVDVKDGTDDQCRDWEKANSKGAAQKNPLKLIIGNRTIIVDLPTANATGEYSFSGRRSQFMAGIDVEKIVFIPDSKGHPDKGSMIRGKLSNGLKNFVGASQFIVEMDINNDHTVKLQPGYSKVKAAFPYLSEAEFNATINDDGYSGSAKFHPSPPLLKKGEVTIQVEKGVFSGAFKAAATDITIPIPGVNITECSLEAAIKEAAFSAKGTLAFSVGPYADAKITAHGDKDGFRAEGLVDFHIPGLDKAQGKITYKDKQLAGQIKIGKDKFKVPGVKSASLTIDITDNAITGIGEVELGVPGIKKGTLAFGVDKKGNYTITGAAALSIPGLKEADVSLTYADGDLSGAAKIGFDIPALPGASGTFDIAYSKGAITGTGLISYNKGKLTGDVHAQLTEKHTIIGGGHLAYQITPNLIAGISVDILEDGSTKITGEISANNIELFPGKFFQKKIFSFGIQIPIFAIPLGSKSVGLVADVGIDILGNAGIGPGLLNFKAGLTVDLANQEHPISFEADAEVTVNAFASLIVALHGGVGLSLAIADVTGGIKFSASLGLLGGFKAKAHIVYKDGLFALDASAELFAQPVLKFDISAYVAVEVDLLLTSFEVYRKEWTLASKEWGGGFKIGVRFPVHYETGKPFDISLDKLEFIKPEIDFMQAVKDLLPI